MTLHVAITGAGGFVGGFAAAQLAHAGFDVTALSRGAGRGPAASRLVWRRADLLEAGALPERCDAIIHCAAELPSRTSEPEALYSLNRRMADVVIEHAERHSVRTVIYLSSMSVYGTINVPEVDENLAPCNPDPYGRAKLDGETALAAAVARGVIESALAIRLPGTVGPGSHHNFLSDALRAILSGAALRANNPDAPFNNIVYVGHLARFFSDWLSSPKPGFFATNLASRDPMTIKDVVARMCLVAGKPMNCEFAVSSRKPFLISLERAAALGYRPATVADSLDEFVRSNLTK